MTLFEAAFERWDQILVWGAVATVAMTTILVSAQMAGLTRLSLPFLLGTIWTGHRRRATVTGYLFYVVGGWLMAALYAVVLEGAGRAWWVGGLIGLLHGAAMVSVGLAILSQLHPRIATPSEGPSARYRLEPPGPFGLHYGRSTPVFTVLAQFVYGLVFAAGYGP